MAKNKAENTDEGMRSFVSFLHQLADGDAADELTEEFHELVHRVTLDAAGRDRVAKGELTLKLTLKVDARRQVSIAYDIKTKDPTKVRPGSMMYLTKGGNLTLENPRQQSLPLREVTSDDGQLRDVDEPAVAREV